MPQCPILANSFDEMYLEPSFECREVVVPLKWQIQWAMLSNRRLEPMCYYPPELAKTGLWQAKSES